MGIKGLFSQLHHVAETFYGPALDVERFKGQDHKLPGRWAKDTHVAHAKAWANVQHLAVDCEGVLFKYPGHGDAEDDYYYKRATLCELAAKMVDNKLRRLAALPSDQLTLLFDDKHLTPALKELEQAERDQATVKTQAAKRRANVAVPKLKRRDVIGSMTLADHIGMSDGGAPPGSSSSLYMYFVGQRAVRSAMKRLVLNAVLDWAEREVNSGGSDKLTIVVRTNEDDQHLHVFAKESCRSYRRDQSDTTAQWVPVNMAGEGELAAFQVVAMNVGKFDRQGVATLSDDTDTLAIGTQMDWPVDAAKELTVCVGTAANSAILRVHELAAARSLRSRTAMSVALSLLGTDYVRRRQLRVAHNKPNDKVLNLYTALRGCISIPRSPDQLVQVSPQKLTAILSRTLLTTKGDALPVRSHWVYRVVFQVEYWGATNPAVLTNANWLAVLQKYTNIPEKESAVVVFVHPDHQCEPPPKKAKAVPGAPPAPAIKPPCSNCEWQEGLVTDIDYAAED